MSHSKFIKLLQSKDARHSEINRSTSQNSLMALSQYPGALKRKQTAFRIKLNETTEFKNDNDDSMHAYRIKHLDKSAIGSQQLKYIIDEFDAVRNSKKRRTWNTASCNMLRKGSLPNFNEQNMLKDVKKRFFNHKRLETQELLYIDNFKDYINKYTNKEEIGGSNTAIEILPINEISDIDLTASRLTIYKIISKNQTTATICISTIIRDTRGL